MKSSIRFVSVAAAAFSLTPSSVWAEPPSKGPPEAPTSPDPPDADTAEGEVDDREDVPSVPANAIPNGPAPEPPIKRAAFGIDLQFSLPVGAFGDASGAQIGPLLRFGYRILTSLEWTLRAFYLFGLSKPVVGQPEATTRASILPMWTGLRYFCMEPYAGLYIAAETGVNFIVPSLEPEGPGGSGPTRTRVGVNGGLGYVILESLPVDVRFQFSYFNLVGRDAGERPALGIGVSAGYTVMF